jgi:signal transduction histidine kinase
VDARAVLRRWSEALSGWSLLFVGLGEPGALPRRPRWLHRAGHTILLFVTLLLTLAALASVDHASPGTQLVAVLGVVPLTVVAVRPLVAWRVAWLAALLSWLFPRSDQTAWPWARTTIIVFIVVLFAVGATQPARVQVWVWAATDALVAVSARLGNQAVLIIFITVVMLAGDQVRRRARAQRALKQQEQRSAVLAERTRIARELHDVVAHHMSMVAVRAETAPYRLGGLAEPVRDEFAQISATARESLVEMRRVLGVLRSEDREILIAPQPRLADLTDLVERARAAGAVVEFDPPATHVGATQAVELTAYRIVQEALSNAARHAPGTPASVEVRRTGGDLMVVVHNGPGHRPVPENPSGHGLLGMRERATAVGGQLSAGRSNDGGFEVRAVLPVFGGSE